MSDDSLFKKKYENKTEAFRPNKDLDGLILELRNLLKPIQENVEGKLENNKWPVGLIVANPRSGTTLLTQWLASLNSFAIPTNFLARFSYAPYIGALIQKLLFDSNFDYQGDFSDIQSSVNYNSNLGKSKGALATNEFHHFFRNYMPNFDPQYLDSKALNEVDFDGIKKGFASIEKAFNKPFIAKGLMLQYNIGEFYHNISNVIFIYLKRNPIDNMISIYNARIKYYSDENIWWSVKPKEYEKLKNMDVYHQIAGQVFYTNKSIEEELKSIPEDRKVIVNYRDFCENPNAFYETLKRKYNNLGYSLIDDYNGKAEFNVSNHLNAATELSEKFSEAYKYFD